MQKYHAVFRNAAAIVLAVASTYTGAQVSISVDKAEQYQTIEGFGGTVSGQYGLRPWNERQGAFFVQVNLDSVFFYDSIISELGLTAIRTAIEAGFNPRPGEYTVTSNMHKNLHDIRKLQQAAERQNEPYPRIIGSLWSPPGRMKVNGEEACAGYTSLECRLLEGYEDSVGVFMTRYAGSYADSGVPFYALSFQNEPAFLEPYSSCVYSPSGYRATAQAVGARLAEAGMPQILFGAEHMSHSFNQFEYPIRRSPEVLAYFKAWAVHGYTDGIGSDTGALSGASITDKPLWMTETSGTAYGTGFSDWAGALAAGRMLLSYLREGRLTLWTWWTLQSPDTTSYTMNIHAGGRPTLKWWISKHFFRYIRPGARQIASTASNAGIRVVAFWHEQNQCLSVVVINTTDAAHTLNPLAVSGAVAPSQYEVLTSTAQQQNAHGVVGGSEQVVLPPNSIVTLVSGAYRGTGEVSATRPVTPEASSRTTGVPQRAALYRLDGRQLRDGEAARQFSGHCRVYVSVDASGTVRYRRP